MPREALRELISIKGTRNGLLIYCNGQADREILKIDLEKKLKAGKGFFHGARYSLHAVSPLNQELEKELHTLCKSYGLVPAEDKIIPPKAVKRRKRQAEIHPAKEKESSKDPAGDTLLVQKSLRSGHELTYDGNVVLLGDVNPGAEITATGNILVMGTLRGIAHAGCKGDINAVIMAYKLHPSQLRIADKIARSPKSLNERAYPELAYATEKEGIIIERYNPNKRR